MNILITGAWQQAQEHIKEIEQMGHRVTFLQQEKDNLPCASEEIEGVICNGLFLYHPIEKFTNLKYIQLTSAGTDRVNTDYIKGKGITLHTARGVYSAPMAEFAIAGVLSVYKNLDRFKEQQKSHQWQKDRSLRELTNKNVLILGCGSVGTECAKRFRAFGSRITGIDIQPKGNEYFDEILPLEDLDSLLQKTDILILTLPLTKETEKLIGREKLNRLKPDAVLVNIARGKIIDREALEEWTGTAVLDVFEEEPLSEDSPLWDKDGWIITPHNSFVGEENGNRLSKLILSNLEE